MALVTDDPKPIPGYRNFLVYCDESGQSGKKYYGFGSLWMPWERRGDFTGLVATLRDRYNYRHEIKWNKIDSRNEPFYRSLIEEFFNRNWLMFHSLVGRKGYLNLKLHNGGYQEALQKQFSLLLRKKIAFFSEGDKRKAYHIVVDKLPYSYDKVDEATHVIVNHELKRDLGFAPIHNLVSRNSRDAAGIQVADVLLGAVVTGWNQEDSGDAKIAVRDCVAEHLGWRHLRADTRPWEWKFNTWFFYDPSEGKGREVATWALNLKHPVPPYVRRRSR
jgi:hypothetical protein